MGANGTRGAAVGNQGGTGGTQRTGHKTGEEKGEVGSGTTGALAGTAPGAPAVAPGTPGAPAKSGTDNNATVNPVSIAPDNYERDANGDIVYKDDGVTPKKKRGRKPGQQYGASPSGAPKSKPAKTDAARATVATEMLAAQFQILNTGIAFLTKFEDFRLDDTEAMQMAEATNNVMAQFDFVPDPKVAAVLGLVTTTSMIYGPRFYLYRKELEKRRKEKQAARFAAADEEAAGNGGNFPQPPFNIGQFSG